MEIQRSSKKVGTSTLGGKPSSCQESWLELELDHVSLLLLDESHESLDQLDDEDFHEDFEEESVLVGESVGSS